VFAEAPLGIRAVTHYGLDAADIRDAVGRIRKVLEGTPSAAKVGV
jgi:hypothetical protein